MVTEHTTANETETGLVFLPSTFTSLDWTKPFTDASMKMMNGLCKEALNFTSRRLQEHAEYCKALAECDNPTKLLYCNGDFLRRSLVNSVEDSHRAFATLRDFSAVSKSS
jgi:hypothetical protein